jgi:hypothetical protein
MWRSRRVWCTLLILVVLATPFVVHLVSRQMEFAENEKLFREAIAETDRLDPQWRWDDLLAAREPVPEERNAVGPVRKVKALLGGTFKWPLPPNDTLGLSDIFSDLAPSQLMRESERRLLDQSLASHEEAIRVARGLIRYGRGRYDLRLPTNPLSLSFRFEQDVREVTSLLHLDSDRRILDGNANEAVEDIRAILAAARAIGDAPTMMGQLFHIAVDAIAVNRLQRLLAMCDDVSGLDGLERQLADEAREPAVSHGMKGERAFVVAFFEGLASNRIPLDEALSEMERFENVFAGSTSRKRRSAYWYRPKVARDGAYYLRIMNRLCRVSDRPLHEQADAYRQATEDAKLHTGDTLIVNFLPTVEKVFQAMQRGRAQLDCARLAIAVERFRQANKRWPASLNEVPFDLLPAVPIDPYDGQPIRFRRTDTGVVVYTLGQNLIDDGGAVEQPKIGDPSLDVGFRLWDPDKRRQPPPPPPWFDNPSATDAAIGVGSGVGMFPERSSDDGIPKVP